MPCRDPCRLYNHLAFANSVSPSSASVKWTWTGSAFSTNESAWSVMVTGSQPRVWSGPHHRFGSSFCNAAFFKLPQYIQIEWYLICCEQALSNLVHQVQCAHCTQIDQEQVEILKHTLYMYVYPLKFKSTAGNSQWPSGGASKLKHHLPLRWCRCLWRHTTDKLSWSEPTPTRSY
jgi:hypothetical protein